MKTLSTVLTAGILISSPVFANQATNTESTHNHVFISTNMVHDSAKVMKMKLKDNIIGVAGGYEFALTPNLSVAPFAGIAIPHGDVKVGPANVTVDHILQAGVTGTLRFDDQLFAFGRYEFNRAEASAMGQTSEVDFNLYQGGVGVNFTDNWGMDAFVGKGSHNKHAIGVDMTYRF